MGNSILQGVIEAAARRLGEAFRCPVYQDDISQGFEQPSIFLLPLEPSRRLWAGGRYIQEFPLDVTCFPSEDGNSRELTLWADRLYDELELLPLPEGLPLNGETLRGTGMRHRVEDGVLHFFVTYRFFLEREAEKINMEEMEHSEKTK